METCFQAPSTSRPPSWEETTSRMRITRTSASLRIPWTLTPMVTSGSRPSLDMPLRQLLQSKVLSLFLLAIKFTQNGFGLMTSSIPIHYISCATLDRIHTSNGLVDFYYFDFSALMPQKYTRTATLVLPTPCMRPRSFLMIILFSFLSQRRSQCFWKGYSLGPFVSYLLPLTNYSSVTSLLRLHSLLLGIFIPLFDSTLWFNVSEGPLELLWPVLEFISFFFISTFSIL